MAQITFTRHNRIALHLPWLLDYLLIVILNCLQQMFLLNDCSSSISEFEVDALRMRQGVDINLLAWSLPFENCSRLWDPICRTDRREGMIGKSYSINEWVWAALIYRSSLPLALEYRQAKPSAARWASLWARINKNQQWRTIDYHIYYRRDKYYSDNTLFDEERKEMRSLFNQKRWW